MHGKIKQLELKRPLGKPKRRRGNRMGVDV